MLTNSLTSFTGARPLSALLASLALFGCDLGKGSIGDDEGGTTTSGSESDSEGTSDSGDSGTDTGESGLCGAENITMLTDLDAIPPRFETNVNAMLLDSEGSYVGTFNWGQNDGPVSLTYAGTSSPLTMDVAYAGGEVVLTEVELAGQLPGEQAGGEPCTNQLEIPVELGFVTEDGVFDELASARLVVYSDGSELAPKLRLELDFDNLGGSLLGSDFMIDGGSLIGATIIAEFANDASTGSLLAEFDILGGVLAGGVASFNANQTAP